MGDFGFYCKTLPRIEAESKLFGRALPNYFPNLSVLGEKVRFNLNLAKGLLKNSIITI